MRCLRLWDGLDSLEPICSLMTSAAKPIQEPDGWDEEISEEELQFLAECMPEHLVAKAAELEQDLPEISRIPNLSEKRPLRRAA